MLVKRKIFRRYSTRRSTSGQYPYAQLSHKDSRMTLRVEKEIARRGLSQCVILPSRFPLALMPFFFKLRIRCPFRQVRRALYHYQSRKGTGHYLAAGMSLLGVFDGPGALKIKEASARPSAHPGRSLRLHEISRQLPL
jgi:hypothetical protein